MVNASEFTLSMMRRLQGAGETTEIARIRKVGETSLKLECRTEHKLGFMCSVQLVLSS